MKSLPIRVIVFCLNKLPLKKLGPVFAALSERVVKHREENKGLIPIEILKSSCEIGGYTASFELIMHGPSGFWVKKRSAQEQGWPGLFQLPCTLVRRHESEVQVLDRLVQGIFGKNMEKSSFAPISIGAHLHHMMSERLATAANFIWFGKVTADQEARFLSQTEGWRAIPHQMLNPENLRTIVPHHARALCRFSEGLRLNRDLPHVFFDVAQT
jgi:hypothetical protein